MHIYLELNLNKRKKFIETENEKTYFLYLK